MQFIKKKIIKKNITIINTREKEITQQCSKRTEIFERKKHLNIHKD